MEVKKFFASAIEQASIVMGRVRPGDLGRPTPNTEWDVRALANHMLYEICWVADLVNGKTIAEVGDKYEGDLVGTDATESWRKAEADARNAVNAADLNASVHLSYGDTPVGQYLKEVATDLLIHAWDLGEGIGFKVNFEEAPALVAYEYLLSKGTELQKGGQFAAPVSIPANAGISAKLLALSGRHEN